MRLGLTALIIATLASTVRSEPTATKFHFPTIGSSAEGEATLLAIDNYSLPLQKNLCYYLSKPKVRKEAILQPRRDDPTAPDSVAAHFYGTVIQENGKFRLWYYGVGWKDPSKELIETNLREGPICYAESDDGIHWTRPNLQQVELQGNRNNNAIALPLQNTQGAFVVRDDSDSDAARRYKMAYENKPDSPINRMSMRTATSADGIKWTAGPDLPIEEGLEPCSFYQHDGLYFVNAQFAPYGISEGGHQASRQGFVWLSPDFNDWIQEAGESFTLPEPQDPAGRGLDKPGLQVHLGTAPRSQGNVLVGLYCRWNSQPKPGDWFGTGTTHGDLGLSISHDGQHFHEPVKGHVFLSRADSHSEIPEGVKYETVLCQGNGILNVGDETRIYHGRWANTEHFKDYYGEIALATLPRDRWGALGLAPAAESGTVWSAPITLPLEPSKVRLNADGVASIKVEIADENFELLPEYSGDNQGTPVAKDGLDCPVVWKNGDLSKLAGKTVRLKIHLARGEHAEPRLYVCYLSTDNLTVEGK